MQLSANLQALAARADAALARLLPAAEQEPIELHQAMRYAVLGGGKRLRPMLVYATGQTFGASAETLDAPAAAVEFVHAYSLIHDDLPAMDDDELRRGRPTCHVRFGEATAILAGDALQALAFELLARDTGLSVDPATRLGMLLALADACGSRGMAGGQALDLAAVGRAISAAELERMHAAKTGALIRASLRLGALGAGCQTAQALAALDEYGRAMGLAFQIRDDLLDLEAGNAKLGKTAGKDAAARKPTYPAVLGVDASRRQLVELTTRAENALSAFGTPAEPLRQLASFAAERSY